jgi:hypothetical protein
MQREKVPVCVLCMNNVCVWACVRVDVRVCAFSTCMLPPSTDCAGLPRASGKGSLLPLPMLRCQTGYRYHRRSRRQYQRCRVPLAIRGTSSLRSRAHRTWTWRCPCKGRSQKQLSLREHFLEDRSAPCRVEAIRRLPSRSHLATLCTHCWLWRGKLRRRIQPRSARCPQES